jgi:hypothetical protein
MRTMSAASSVSGSSPIAIGDHCSAVAMRTIACTRPSSAAVCAGEHPSVGGATTTLTVPELDYAELDLGNLELWQDGPPHELFAQVRAMVSNELATFAALVGVSGPACATTQLRR